MNLSRFEYQYISSIMCVQIAYIVYRYFTDGKHLTILGEGGIQLEFPRNRHFG